MITKLCRTEDRFGECLCVSCVISACMKGKESVNSRTQNSPHISSRVQTPPNFSEPSRYSSRYSHANEVDGGRLGGEAADDASLPAIHKSKMKNNLHMLPNGDAAGGTPIRIPVPPVTRHITVFSPPSP